MDSGSRRVGAVVTAIAPQLSGERLELLIRYAIWSIELDDRLDAADADPARLELLRQMIDDITAGRWAATDEPFLAELMLIRHRLSAFDRTRIWVGAFGLALREAVASGIEHSRLSRAVADGAAPGPTLDGYLAIAAPSLNYRSFALALLALSMTDGSDLDGTAPALCHAARALRLANDLRSVARDRAEHTLNVLNLLTPAGAPMTPLFVQHEIGRHVLRHNAVLAELDTPAAPVLARSLRVSLDLYRRADLR